MDYEKKYKNALEWARQVMNGETGFIRKEVEEVFPELRESEDERIRQFLIHEVTETSDKIMSYRNMNKKDVLAWLEKQGNLMKALQFSNSRIAELVEEKYNLEEKLKKQGEQKPQGKSALEAAKEEKVDNANKIEPKFKVKYAGSEYNVFEIKDIAGVIFYGIEDEPNHIDYVKADNCEIISGYGFKESGLSFPTKPVMFSEQKSSWSEEDENRINRLIAYFEDKESFTAEDDIAYANWLKSLKDILQVQPQREWNEEEIEKAAQEWDSKANFNPFYMTMEGNNPTGVKQDITTHEESFKAGVNWILKSLKGRVQPKQEWSEENEIIRKALINLVEMYYGRCIDKTEKNRLLNFLKSLRPQNHWKPSYWQMEAIKDAIKHYNSLGYNASILKELLNELEKLKG